MVRRAFWRGVGALSLLIVALAAGPPVGAAVAASGATLQVLPSTVPGPASFSLSSVACHAATCTAVGSYLTLNSFGESSVPFAAMSSGGTWTAARLPAPPGVQAATFASVACPTADWCATVGFSDAGSPPSSFPVAGVLSSGRWSVKSLPLPSGGSGPAELSGVACPVKGRCVAVGFVQKSGKEVALAEVLSNGVWTASTPAAPRAGDARLGAVACAGVLSCVALGSLFGGGLYADSYTPTGWVASMLPAAPQNPNPALAAISCPSAGTCVAVGTFTTKAGVAQPLGETLSGGTWTPTPLPSPSKLSTTLDGISCPAIGSCIATGTTTGTSTPFAETLSAGLWTSSSLPAPPSPEGSTAAAVSCTATTSCLAVGTAASTPTNGVALTETLASGTWTAAEPTFPTPPDASVAGISCGSSEGCVAVGDSTDSSGSPLVSDETLQSGSWTAGSVPLAPSGTIPNEVGVSCPSATWCLASGDLYDSASPVQVEAQTLSGGTWSAVQIPPDGSTDASRPSCPVVGWCAVIVDRALPVAAILADGTWTSTALPVPPGASGQVFVSDLSCAAIDACVAVGSFDDATGGHLIAYSLAQGSWSATTLPSTPDAPGATLSAISCPVIGSCLAVGKSANDVSAVWSPFIETLANGTWHADTLALPSGVLNESFSGISCTATMACVAVGIRSNADRTPAALTATLTGGSWTRYSLANATGTVATTLTGVACPVGGACEAVGSALGTDGGSHSVAVTLPEP
jgi:hypothetical protein